MSDPLNDNDPLVVTSGGSPAVADIVPPGERAHLAEVAKDLIETNEALGKSVTNLTKKLRFRTRAVAAVLVADLLLTFGAFFLYEQVKTLVHENCTLYGFIIPSYRESSRATSPLGPAGYDTFYYAMQTSADHLGCNIKHRI